MDDRSRMNREAHVRFRERLGVKLPRPTRPTTIAVGGGRKPTTYRLFAVKIPKRGRI